MFPMFLIPNSASEEDIALLYGPADIPSIFLELPNNHLSISYCGPTGFWLGIQLICPEPHVTTGTLCECCLVSLKFQPIYVVISLHVERTHCIRSTGDNHSVRGVTRINISVSHESSLGSRLKVAVPRMLTNMTSYFYSLLY